MPDIGKVIIVRRKGGLNQCDVQLLDKLAKRCAICLTSWGFERAAVQRMNREVKKNDPCLVLSREFNRLDDNRRHRWCDRTRAYEGGRRG